MNVFIIGTSCTGKTPFAKKISKRLNLKHISASEYFRTSFNEKGSGKDFIESITEYSKKKLQKNYRVNIDYIGSVENSVVEGIRNPIDFSNLFNFNKDKVVFLEYENQECGKTAFENGIEIIKEICLWSTDMGILPKENIKVYSYNNFYGKDSLEEKIEEFLNDSL